MVKRGWQDRKRIKLLEELKAMKQSFPNHQLIEFSNERIGFIGTFTVKDEKKYFKVIYPLSYPQSNPRVYLLENKDARARFGKVNRKIIKEKLNYYVEMEKMGSYYKDLGWRC